jgi:hypothetical protein
MCEVRLPEGLLFRLTLKECKVVVSSYRSLFDGSTLEGWRAVPRIYTPVSDLSAVSIQHRTDATRYLAEWNVEDGAIVGRQNADRRGFGGYLVSEETFGDFELVLEANPDWGADTGIMLRRHRDDITGLQVLVDHRQSGSIGGFFGNGLADFHAMSFAIDVRCGTDGVPVGLVEFDPARSRDIYGPTPDKAALLSYGVQAQEFIDAWRWAEWNEIRVICRGELPVLTTWINGVKIAELDTSTIVWPNYDAEAVRRSVGGPGHIAFEVHDNDPRLGDLQWLPGAACRWRNIRIRELPGKETA